MARTAFKFPDRTALTVGLRSALNGNGCSIEKITILSRRRNLYVSTFASEIVSCRLDRSPKLRLFCKYGGDHGHQQHGHKSAVPYEAQVYRHVLQPLRGAGPKFYGSYRDPDTGETWLVIEYLPRSWRMDETPHPAAERLAVKWLGRFHAANEARLSSAPMPFLNVYNAEYYAGWARRTSRIAQNFTRRFAWLRTVCERFGGLATALLMPKATVIHGEFYPHNVLVQEERIYPVDWESAAIAAGEIDLASMMENWTADESSEYLLDYQKARWPQGAPVEFQSIFAAAQLYWTFRWLGDESDGVRKSSWDRYLRLLRSAAERLAVI